MSVNSNFYLDAAVSRHELRDMLVRANIGLKADKEFYQISKELRTN